MSDQLFERVELGDIAERSANSFVDGPFGSSLKSDEYTNVGVRLIQLQNIGINQWLDSNQKFISDSKFQVLSRHGAIPGDIAIAKMAEPVARACIVPPVSDQFVVVADCIRLRPDVARFVPSYVVRAINSPYTRLEAEKKATGSTRVRINLTTLKSVGCLVPPYAHQSKIAEILDTLDAAIRGGEAVVAKLKAMKQGLLQDLLTRGIDANGRLRPPQPEAPHLYKQTPLGWLPKDWTETTLGEIAQVDRGQFTHRPRNDPAYYGGTFPFIQTGDVAAAKGDFVTRCSQSLNEKGASVSKEFPAGTIAITIAANIADTGILSVPMYFPDSVVGAVVKPDVDIRFVELWIRRAKRLLDARAPQSAQKNINLQDLRPLEVFLPVADEQIAIGSRYEALFEKLNEEQALLEKLRLQKIGLMDDLLTGETPVTALL